MRCRIALVILLSAPLALGSGVAPALAQPAASPGTAKAEAPPPPPSSFEERLQEYKQRQQQETAARKARQQARLNRLTGAGQPAGAEAGATAGPPISLPRVVNAAFAAAFYYVAVTVLRNEDTRNQDGGSSGVSATTSTN